MKKTEYVSFSDQELIKLLQDVGSDYSALELIDENNNVDAIVVSQADFDYFLSKLDDDEREQYLADDSDADWIEEK